MIQEDNQLVEQILKNNDQKASNLLYKSYYKEIKLYIKKKFNKLNSDDIDDLSSDTITKSFINLKSFDSNKSTFKTWIYTIAENIAIDYTRKLENRVDKIYYNKNDNNFDISLPENYEDLYSVKQEISHITSNLNIETNDMISKKYVEGYSYNEIGELYSLTSSTVSNKINYAKSKLNKKFNEKKKRGT